MRIFFVIASIALGIIWFVVDIIIVLFYIHHVEEHQSRRFVLFFLCKFLKAVLAIELYGGKVGSQTRSTYSQVSKVLQSSFTNRR